MFGDPEDFAIAAESDATAASPASTVWGHMRIWCRGVSFGDFTERHCGLSGAHQELVRLSATLDTLKSREFSNLGDSGAWHFVECWSRKLIAIRMGAFLDDGVLLCSGFKASDWRV